MVENSRQALVGAIGGTYISLAIGDIDELALSNFALLNSANFKSPMEAIARYLKSVPRCPDKVGLSIAGQVEADTATMNHLPWRFDWNDIRAVTGAKHVAFVNEFEALALAVPRMSAYDLIPIGKGEPRLHGTRLAISAGTGLGSAALLWTGEKSTAMSGNSALASLPPIAEGAFDIGAALGAQGPVPAGQVLTGKGLVALYAALGKSRGRDTAPLTPEQITKAGLSGEDEIAAATLEQMSKWLGRFAGDLALHFGASGGVYLAGGMPSNMPIVLQSGGFRAAFEGTGERQALLGHVPVHVLKTGADAGMRGAAVALANSLPVRGPGFRRLSA